MHPHSLALCLPPSIRSQLARLCYGIPHVQWAEQENFHIKLRSFGPLSDRDAALISECLATLFFVKIPLILKGVGHFHQKGNRGSLWVGVENSTELSALKKQIDQLLRNLSLRPEEHAFLPHVTLGRYDHLHPQKLGDYLMAHADYQSERFDVSCCQLLTSHQTPKHLHYKVVEEFNAECAATGED